MRRFTPTPQPTAKNYAGPQSPNTNSSTSKESKSVGGSLGRNSPITNEPTQYKKNTKTSTLTAMFDKASIQQASSNPPSAGNNNNIAESPKQNPPPSVRNSTPQPPVKQASPAPKPFNSTTSKPSEVKSSPASQVRSTPTSQAKPAPAPRQAVKFAVELAPEDESAQRSKPLGPKPKPDAKRVSTKLPQGFKFDDIETPKPPVVPEPEKPLTSSGKTNNNTPFEVSDKWRINYEELDFEDLVSSGSAGDVYLGYYFGTPVAIKKLFAIGPDQRHLVAREYSMLTEVNHPNIVQFLGVCDHETGIYLITEYVEHGDLFDLLIFGDKSSLGWKLKTRIALQIAQAVFYLHSRGIIHRDLKSQNVLIGENNKVKLCDLGLATLIENSKRMTVCGTNEWMAPEIMMADKYDSKVDVFSFGIVLTEMITNAPPAKREIAKMLAFDVPKFKASAPSSCPSELIQIVIDCCKSAPAERPTFKEIVPRLRKLHDALDDD